MKYQKLRKDHAVHIYVLHKDKGVKIRDIRKRYKHYSKSSVYRHARADIAQNLMTEDMQMLEGQKRYSTR